MTSAKSSGIIFTSTLMERVTECGTIREGRVAVNFLSYLRRRPLLSCSTQIFSKYCRISALKNKSETQGGTVFYAPLTTFVVKGVFNLKIIKGDIDYENH